MRILKTFVLLLLVSAAAAISDSWAQPQEFKSFLAVPEVIQPGVVTTFKFVFSAPLDTSVSPIVEFKMPDDNNLSLPAYWSDVYSCNLSYSFPNTTESGTADITLTGIKTQDGKEVEEVHLSVQVIPGPTPGSMMK